MKALEFESRGYSGEDHILERGNNRKVAEEGKTSVLDKDNDLMKISRSTGQIKQILYRLTCLDKLISRISEDLATKRLDLTLQVVDIFAADVFHHKSCK